VRTGEVVFAVSYVPETICDVPAKIGERIAKGIVKKAC
jgi:hypothetical protein